MKLSKQGKIIIGSLIVFIILIALLCYKRVVFSLKGEESVQIILPDSYIDPGVKAQKCGLFGCQDLSNKVTIKNEIAANKIGDFQVKYELQVGSKKYELIRNVNVTEKIAPIIKLKGSSEIKICSGTSYKEEGYTATDNYDGDITDKVTKEIKNGFIYYRVLDSANNVGEATRKYTYNDTEKPVIKFDNETLYVAKGEKYIDNFKATDNCDGDITSNVKITGNVDTSKGGTYTLTYSVSDALGNDVSVKRNVIVYDFDTKDLTTLINSLEAYIKVKGYHVSIGYYNINKDYTYKYNADKIYYGASLIKTLDALYVYEKMDLTKELQALVKPTIEKSDNNTHRKLVDIIGINNIRKYGQDMGAKEILNRYSSDYYGNTIVDDQLIYMKYLYNFINNEKVDKAKREELKNYFINDFYKYLKFDGAPTIMHKYGYYSYYYHDVGIVLDENPYIVVILTEEANNDFKIVTDLSEKIYRLHKLV